MPPRIPVVDIAQSPFEHNVEKIPYTKPLLKLLELHTATAGKSASSAGEYGTYRGTDTAS